MFRQVGLLGAIFNYEIKRGRCERNPLRMIDMPRPVLQEEIHYLSTAELERLIVAVPISRLLGRTQRVLYLTAAMTGLRRGELLALGWQDVDAVAGVIRVRRSYRRGEFGTPKSRRSSRAVPLAERVRIEVVANGLAAEHIRSPGYPRVMARPERDLFPPKRIRLVGSGRYRAARSFRASACVSGRARTSK